MKSRLLITTAVASAFLAASCGTEVEDRSGEWTAEEDTKVCTDQQGNRVDDAKCAAANTQRAANGAATGFFVWYFLSRGGIVPRIGAPVTGGSYKPATGRSYKAASVARGGFGSRGGGSYRGGVTS